MGHDRWQAAFCGLWAAAAGLAAAEVATAAGLPSLTAAAGQRIIRSAPAGVVHAAIKSLGTADKPVLVSGLVAAVLLGGAVSGMAALRRPLAVDLLTAAVAGAGWACALSLGAGPGRSLIPSATGSLAAIGVRRASLAALGAQGPTEPPLAPDLKVGPITSRRRFLAAGGIAAGSTAAAVGSAAALRHARRGATPTALPLVAGQGGSPVTGLSLPGLSPLITPTGSFYRIDEALIVPSVDASTWRLRVTGLVGTPLELSYSDLLAASLVEHHITLCCVSNEVGGRLIGTARWTGVRLDSLLQGAGIDPAATQVVGRSVDGFTVGFPVAAALDGRNALVAVGMNGEPLLPKHGFPARLVVPGLYGFVSATKWLKEIELTTFDAFTPYWAERGWARQAPVKPSSRIDVPKDYSRVAPGRQAIAGVAWAPTSGIAAVRVRIDGGRWSEARLGPELGGEAWLQWWTEWDPTPGPHTIEAQVVTKAGVHQIEEKRSAFPEGASGLHTSHVRVVPPG